MHPQLVRLGIRNFLSVPLGLRPIYRLLIRYIRNIVTDSRCSNGL